MGQVRDSLIWLAMILVVAGVIYLMPQVARYVDAATGSEQKPACATCRNLNTEVSHHHD
jgi:hypothetical protein